MLKNFRRRVLAQPALTIVLLAAAGLPTAALADALTFSSGTFVSGTWRVMSATNVKITIVRSQDTFTFDFSRPNNLKQVSTPPIPDRCMTPPMFFFCSDINSGTLTIADPAGQQIFTGTFNGGVVKEYTLNFSSTQMPNSNFGNLIIDGILGSGTCFGPLAPCIVEPGGEVTLNVNKGANSRFSTSGNLMSGEAEGEIPGTPVSTPEPSHLLLLGISFAGLGGVGWRRRVRVPDQAEEA